MKHLLSNPIISVLNVGTGQTISVTDSRGQSLGTANNNSFTDGVNSTGTLKLAGADSLGIIGVPSSSVGSNQSFTYAGTGNNLVVGTSLLTGQVFTVTTTGTLPTGLGTGTNYYAISTTGTTMEAATSYANAIGGTAISLSGTSTNTGTVVPTVATTTGTAQLQVSNDGSTFVTLGTATNVTFTLGTAFTIFYDRPQFHYAKVLVSGITAGVANTVFNVVTKTDTI